jgi:solute carrier family 32 (vesicular inhibitory amino acid transporter)
VHLSTLPVSFGLLAFVFAGHAVFPAIYTSMEKPEEYPAMLDKARSIHWFPYDRVRVVNADP